MQFRKGFLVCIYFISCFSCLENTGASKKTNTKKSDLPKIEPIEIPETRKPIRDSLQLPKKEEQPKRRTKDTLTPLKAKP